jgi:putative spermidine/putrescine transport system substrate-binding protein
MEAMLFRLCAVAALMLAACFAPPMPGAAAEEAADGVPLAIATWGGAYGQSQDVAYFEPFTKKTGVKIKSETYDGSLAAIKAKLGQFDVLDLSPAALDALCREGLLDKIDKSTLEAGAAGQSVDEDFVAGGLTDCGVASTAWATAIAFDRQAFTKAQPTQIPDLLDMKRFPGKRALPKGPRYTLELALLADGVAPEAVYSELGTPQGVDRAFAALDKIKPDILWWDNAQDAVTWLTQKKASMAASYSGRIFRGALGARQRLAVLWDGQIYDLDLWAIPKDAKNKDAAKRFIAFASAPSQMAAQAALIAYGPMRKSAIDLVGKHPAVDIEVKAYLPTAPDNFRKALPFNEAWWSEHGAELGARFQAWLEQPSAAAEGSKPEAGAGQPKKPASAETKKPAAGEAQKPASNEPQKPSGEPAQSAGEAPASAP